MYKTKIKFEDGNYMSITSKLDIGCLKAGFKYLGVHNILGAKIFNSSEYYIDMVDIENDVVVYLAKKTQTFYPVQCKGSLDNTGKCNDCSKDYYVKIEEKYMQCQGSDVPVPSPTACTIGNDCFIPSPTLPPSPMPPTPPPSPMPPTPPPTPIPPTPSPPPPSCHTNLSKNCGSLEEASCNISYIMQESANSLIYYNCIWAEAAGGGEDYCQGPEAGISCKITT